jgi:hypothetical protein
VHRLVDVRVRLTPPGMTILPAASITRPASVAASASPTEAICSPAIPTSSTRS